MGYQKRHHRHSLLVVLIAVIVCMKTRFVPVSVAFSFSQHRRSRKSLLQASGVADKDNKESSVGKNNINEETPIRFFLDIAIQGQDVGRLICVLPKPESLFPTHTKNLIQLLKQTRRSIDPQSHYCNCEFNFSPQSIELFPQYKWAHVLPGRGRNAQGPATERISDTASCQAHTHRMYGGLYYGLEYETLTAVTLPDMYPNDPTAAQNTALLTIPMVGPGRGSTQFSLVRVNESPPEWRERLLLNSAVIGWLSPESREVLKAMARQKVGPPVVVDTGIVVED